MGRFGIARFGKIFLPLFLFFFSFGGPVLGSANPYQDTLPNGLPVLILERPGTSSVSVDLWLKVGSRYESQGNNGISHFVEHLLFKGTFKRTAKDISREIAGIGGVMNAYTHWEYTHVHVSILPQYLDLALEILSDMIQNSQMTEEMVEKERKVILEEISLAKIYPPSYVLNLVSRTLFSDHPLFRPISGTRETVSALQRTELWDFYRNYYIPNNAFLTIIGNVEPREARESARAKFKNWPREEKPIASPFPPYRQNAFKEVKERRFLDQAIIVLALQAMGLRDIDRPAFEIINAILGSGGNSRFYQEVREKRGLAYLVGSIYHPLTDTGLWATYAGTDPKNIDQVRSIFSEQIHKIRQEPIPPDELLEIKNYIRGRTLIRNENNSALADYIGPNLVSGSWELPETFIARVQTVTAQDVMRVAQVYLQDNQCNLIILRPYPGLMLFRGLF